MHTTEVIRNWNKTKGKLKQKFAGLTDNNLMLAESKKDEMIGRLMIKLGQTRGKMQKK